MKSFIMRCAQLFSRWETTGKIKYNITLHNNKRNFNIFLMCHLLLTQFLRNIVFQIFRSLTLSVVRHLATLSRLFPNSFNEKLCEQLFTHLGKWLEVVLHKHSTHVDIQPELKLCVAILDIFHLIPLAPQVL